MDRDVGNEDLGCCIETNETVDTSVVVEIKLVILNEIPRGISEKMGNEAGWLNFPHPLA